MPLNFAIDVLAVFDGRLSLSGWIVGAEPIVRLELCSSGLPGWRQPLRSYGNIDSPDIAVHHGPAAARVRFVEKLEFSGTNEALVDIYLLAHFGSGTTETAGDLVANQPSAAAALIPKFFSKVQGISNGHLLEVGSRARSKIVRRQLVPAGWDYTGFDVLDGPNVDVVGDVHEISTFFPQEGFDAVMAFSVLEHLLMPWKVIIELNKILKVGAVGLFTTAQCWPLHDAPWDFWRFSDRAWDGLINRQTGFEIISAEMAEPAFVVAQRCHPVTNFGLYHSGYLASNVLFRKIGPTQLEWKVSLNEIVSTQYPPGNIF